MRYLFQCSFLNIFVEIQELEAEEKRKSLAKQNEMNEVYYIFITIGIWDIGSS
jgi:hypothetical protein